MIIGITCFVYNLLDLQQFDFVFSLEQSKMEPES